MYSVVEDEPRRLLFTSHSAQLPQPHTLQPGDGEGLSLQGPPQDQLCVSRVGAETPTGMLLPT